MATQSMDWRRLAARMRGDLDRSDITGRARRLAEFAIKVTLMEGRTRVVIPQRQQLCDLLRIGKNHVAEVIAALESSKILHVSEMSNGDGWELLVYPDSSCWDVDWLYTREQMQAFTRFVNGAAGQCQGELLPQDPTLRRLMAEVSAENAGSQNGNCARESQQKAVPKMGTDRPFNLKVKESKESKAYSFESLKGAVLAIEGRDERLAMDGCRQVLGDAVMDNDGGKWRNRWRINPGKVHRVFASAVEDLGGGKVRQIGAHTEWLWKQFAD